MTRVDELQKKYRGLPREVIVKLELHRNGIRDSEALDKVGYWARSEGVGTYQSYDRDVSLKDRAQKRPGTVRPGYVKRLGSLYMKNGLGVRIERDSTSSYEVREISEGRFALCEGDDKVEEVYFPRKPMPYDDREEPETSKGTPVSSLVSPKSPVCATIVPVRYCEYFAHGEQCKFCNYNATQEDARSIGALRSITANLEETVEAYKILSSDVRLAEVRSSMGAFREVESETRIYFDFVEKIASGASYKPDLLIGTQPMDRKSMQRLKDTGLDCINFCVELWSADLFAEVCPGKAKYRGFERYKEAYLEAVEVFGAGKVGASFVGGVSLIPPDGHKTWQESRDGLIEGHRWLIERGVVPIFLTLRLGLGSNYGDDKSNQAKLAPTEYYVDAAVANHEAMEEHGLYPKLNKFLWCALDCLENHYSQEIGILERAGNMGNWMADVVSNEGNWLAGFVSSISKR